jgi:hypothetical protein
MMICKVYPMKNSASLKFFDMVCAMRSFENINEDNVEEWPKSYEREVGF